MIWEQDPVQEHYGMTESKAGYRLQGLGSGEQKQVADSQFSVLLRTSS